MGLKERKRRITVRIPPGIDTGYQLRLRGQGDRPPGAGIPGNLYINVLVSSHKDFERVGDDLLYDLEIGFPQATLGAQIPVPTLHGDTKVRIRKGTRPGDIVKLKGRGMPKLHGYGRGDLLVRVNVSIPRNLTKKQKTLITELAKEFKQEINDGN